MGPRDNIPRSPTPLNYAVPGPRPRLFSGSVFLATGVPLWCLAAVLGLVVPKLEVIYREFHVSLPAPTALALLAGRWVAGGGWIVLCVLPVVFGFALARRQARPRVLSLIWTWSLGLIVLGIALAVFMPLISLLQSLSAPPKH